MSGDVHHVVWVHEGHWLCHENSGIGCRRMVIRVLLVLMMRMRMMRMVRKVSRRQSKWQRTSFPRIHGREPEWTVVPGRCCVHTISVTMYGVGKVVGTIRSSVARVRFFCTVVKTDVAVVLVHFIITTITRTQVWWRSAHICG